MLNRVLTSDQRNILERATEALARTAGIKAHIVAAKGRDSKSDAILEFKTGRRTHHFTAEVKAVDRFVIPAKLKAQARSLREPVLLVAPYITREIAERCRQLCLPFIDTAGNTYIEAPGLFVYVVGIARPAELRRDDFRALNSAGLKLMFALLCRPGLLNESYRKIATESGVALGTVSSDMKDLESRGFFELETHPAERKLLDPERMLEDWITHYPVTSRPKLVLGRFQAEPDHMRQLDISRQLAFWSGEPAAEKLTRYLKPERFTIYTQEPIAKLVGAGRMRATKDGNVEILNKFWSFHGDQEFPDVVPPILAYADLLATHDSRNAEAARMIYTQRIEPALRTSS